jgi:hypothetical protein
MGGGTMPRGHAQKRETKKPRKKDSKQPSLTPPIYATTDVDVVKKKRKPREEEEEERESS